MSGQDSSELNSPEIQGFILRGYHMNFVRHFVLKVTSAEGAKRILAKSISGDSDFPQLTSAQPWGSEKPAYCLNIGVTYQGLSQLIDTSGINFPGVNYDDNFRDVFKEGAKAAAPWNGDIGESSPDHWEGQLGSDDAHVIFSLFSLTAEALEEQSKLISAALAAEDSFALLHTFEGQAFPEGRIHFGYRDGISQPQIQGGSGKKVIDQQPIVPSSQFVMESTFATEKENALLTNGSFSAFRVLKQDVVAFDQFLESQKDKISPEELAAKMCGRWRDGNPLVLDPDNQTPVAEKDINNFNYKDEDPDGERCPFSAHMRRANPRRQRVKGSNNGEGVKFHRIIRRGMPYGPEYQPGAEEDGIERGLLGMFICANLADQFEFIMKDWLLGQKFAGASPVGQDPLLGTDGTDKTLLNIPRENEPTLKVTGFPRFIQTRGCAYLLLPSVSGLRFLTESGAPV